MTPDFKSLHRDCLDSLMPSKVDALAATWQVRPAILSCYGVGTHPDTGTASFPRKQGDGKVCGLWLADAPDWTGSVAGSLPGIFMPDEDDIAAIPEGVCQDESAILLVILCDSPRQVPRQTAHWANRGYLAVGTAGGSMADASLAAILERANRVADITVIVRPDGPRLRTSGRPATWWGKCLATCKAIGRFARSVRVEETA